MKSFILKLSVVLSLIGLTYILFAQQTDDPKTAAPKTVDPLGELLKEDSAATHALAAYPDTIRKAVLAVCNYPEGILKIEELQKTTKQNFRDLLAPLAKEEQERIWNITRYEGLVEKLGSGGKKSGKELELIAENYPEDVRADIIKSGSENYGTLEKIVSLNKSTASAFNENIKSYPTDVQNAYHTLVKYPELVELLGGSMRMVVKAGDLQKQYPEKLNHQFDSLNIEIARQKTKETEDWKNGLENNPEAKEEFVKATKDYENEHTVSDNTVVNQTVIVNYVCQPYSYWYGYPWWWNHPYWYPYPYWYASGYYYSPYGIVFFGYPTPYYTYWYFYHYHHHYHYCHFSDHYINHYYGHRRTPSSSGRVVGNWIKEEQPRVTAGFFTKDATRVDRLKELGRAEIDRADYNAKNPGKTMSRDAFIKSNPATYPNLSVSTSQRENVPAAPTKDHELNKPVPPVQKKPDVIPQKPQPHFPPQKQKPPVIKPAPKNPPSQSPKPVPKSQPKTQQPK